MAGSPVIIPPVSKHTATVIFLHGLGDSGNGWKSAFMAIRSPSIKYVLPNAPTMPVSLNNGFVMPAWYDIRGLNENASDDAVGIKKTAMYIRTLIQAEIDAGIESNRIILGGFSQGGAIALYAGMTMDVQLAGIVALSCYLPCRDEFPNAYHAMNKATPILHCHGDRDPVVAYQWGQKTHQLMSSHNMNVSFKTYPGLQHGANNAEITDIRDWIEKNLNL